MAASSDASVATGDSKEATADTSTAQKRGVVYLARVPPFMKPAKVRHLLEMAGPIDRIYLVPESDESRGRRVRTGGNKKQMYTEGWVEYLRRADAKRCAELFHNRPVVANQRGFHGSDLWALKYLRKFQWHHLQEKLQFEQRLRAARLRSGLSEARRENEAYLRRVGAADRYAAVERAKRRRAADGEGVPAAAAEASPAPAADSDGKRTRVKEPASSGTDGSAGRAQRVAAADAAIAVQRAKVTRRIRQSRPIAMRLGRGGE